VLTNHRSPRIIVVGQGAAWLAAEEARAVELPIGSRTSTMPKRRAPAAYRSRLSLVSASRLHPATERQAGWFAPDANAEMDTTVAEES